MKKYKDVIYILVIFIMGCWLMCECNRNDKLNSETIRLENNIKTLNDTLTVYVDENGRLNGERHAFQLTEDELCSRIDVLENKNREYLSYINTNVEIHDTITVPTYIERTIQENNNEQGIISFHKSDTFGKSNRTFDVSIPYSYNDSLIIGNAGVNMYQNIYLESMLERDNNTGETYVRFITDYQNTTFNDGMGVVVVNQKSYEREMRKNKGIGISIGPQIGLSYDLMNKRVVPTIGIGVSIGFNYTPKWTQF